MVGKLFSMKTQGAGSDRQASSKLFSPTPNRNLTALGSPGLQHGEERLRHLLWHFKHSHLRRVAFVMIRNPEKVPALQMFEQSYSDGGKNSELSCAFFRVFERIDLGEGDGDLSSGIFKLQSCVQTRVEPASSSFFESRHCAAYVGHLASIHSNGG